MLRQLPSSGRIGAVFREGRYFGVNWERSENRILPILEGPDITP